MKDNGENCEESVDHVMGRLGLGGEAVKRRAREAQVGDRGRRDVLVFELLRHGAYGCAEVVVVVARGVAEARED